VTYGNNQFVILDCYKETILTSSDGIIWVVKKSDTTKDLYSITYGNNQFVAVGALGKIITSSDGKRWTVAHYDTTSYIFSVAYGGGTFAAIGTIGTYLSYGDSSFAVICEKVIILSSNDGKVWTPTTIKSNYNCTSITYGNDHFVAVGARGTILTSP